jgi:ABC-type polar amino acid transport system ATPase subunit
LTGFLNQPEIAQMAQDSIDEEIIFKNATIVWSVAENVEAEVTSRAFKLRGVELALPAGRFTLVCGPLGSGKTLFVSNCQNAS